MEGLRNRTIFSIIFLQAEFRVAEPLRQLVHFVADGLVDDPGVDLRRAEFRVAEHLADRLDRDAVGIGDRRCETWTRKRNLSEEKESD